MKGIKWGPADAITLIMSVERMRSSQNIKECVSELKRTKMG